jgi:hypothetical protein
VVCRTQISLSLLPSLAALKPSKEKESHKPQRVEIYHIEHTRLSSFCIKDQFQEFNQDWKAARLTSIKLGRMKKEGKKKRC